MPRFHLKLRRPGLSLTDEGRDFADLEDAKAFALNSAREVLAGNLSITPLAVAITDEHGKELALIPAKNLLPEST
jgi:hypothetical protein